MLGGMRAVTWTQIAQYIVLIVAYLTPIIILSTKKYGIPIPRTDIRSGDRGHHRPREADAARTDWRPLANLKPHIQPGSTTPAQLLRDHLLHDGRYGVAAAHPDALFHHPSVREARQSVAWSLFFIFLLYFSAPAYAAFSKLEVYTNIIGRDVSTDSSLDVHLGRTRTDPGLRQECRQPAAVIDACKAMSVPAWCACRTS